MKIIKKTIFPFDIVFSDGNKDETVTYLKDNGYKITKDDEVFFGDLDNKGECTRFGKLGMILIYIPGKLNLGALVHETNHAVTFIMDYIGESASINNMETPAYLQEYIFNQVLTNKKQ